MKERSVFMCSVCGELEDCDPLPSVLILRDPLTCVTVYACTRCMGEIRAVEAQGAITPLAPRHLREARMRGADPVPYAVARFRATLAVDRSPTKGGLRSV